jgi:hypothetical protein
MQSLSLITLMSKMTLALPMSFISKLDAINLLAVCTTSMLVKNN